MKPIIHGIDIHRKQVFEEIPSEKVNVKELILYLEANWDKEVPKEIRENFKIIAGIYRTVFTVEQLPEGYVSEVGHQYVEMAVDDLHDDLSTYINRPHLSNQFDYYYEYARGIGMDLQASALPEHLDEESDFI